VRCDTFITEATFGTPKFVWPKGLAHGELIHRWWRENSDSGASSLLFGYSLGKAQPILAELAPVVERPVLVHKSIVELTECYRRQGLRLAPTRELEDAIRELGPGEALAGELILAPPSILAESWKDKLGRYKTAFASGWMQGGGFGQRRYDHGFVMSDHADWNDLNQTIRETGANRIFVQHRNGSLVRHLKAQGYEAHPVEQLAPENYAYLSGMNLSLL
jgi:putative mRNA 3-end processing factor